MNQDVTKHALASTTNNNAQGRPTRARPDGRLTAYRRRSPALRAGALLVIAGCSAVEAPDPVEASASSALTIYDDQYKLALPLLVNELGTQTGALPGLGWHTGAVVQNTTGALARVKLTAYTGDGSASGSVERTINPYENLVFRPDNAGYPGTTGIPLVAAGHFQGAMVVEADQRVAAVGQLSNLEQTATIDNQTVTIGHPDGEASAAYAGLSLSDLGTSAGQDLVYPTLKCGYAGKSTTLFVQNVGQTAGSVTIEFKTNKAGTLSTTISLGANESRAVACSDFGVPACSGAGLLGSVWLASSSNLRFGAVAVEHATPPCPPAAPPVADTVMAHELHQEASAAREAYCPVFKNQFQFPVIGSQLATSGIAITNASSATADIDLTLRGSSSPSNPASGHTYHQLFWSVPAGATVVASPWAGTIGGFPVGGLGWAKIDSSQPIVAQVNEGASASQSGQRCASTPDDELLVPSYKSAFPLPINPSTASTKVTVLNAGDTTASLTLQLACRDGSSYLRAVAVAPLEALPIRPDTFARYPLPGNLFCALRLESPGARLIGAVEESTEGLANAPRDSLIYEPARFD